MCAVNQTIGLSLADHHLAGQAQRTNRLGKERIQGVQLPLEACPLHSRRCSARGWCGYEAQVVPSDKTTKNLNQRPSQERFAKPHRLLHKHAIN